jgi:hypothetical protein
VFSETWANSSWDGYYVRGGISSFGWGWSKVSDIDLNEKKYTRVETFVEGAVGFGRKVLPHTYVGVDAQLANLGVFNYSNAGTSVYYTPNVQLKIGIPLTKALPYIAGGFGYTQLLGTTVATNNENGNWTYSFRGGSQVGITPSIFIDVFGQLVNKFKANNIAEQVTETSFGWSIGCALGYAF